MFIMYFSCKKYCSLIAEVAVQHFDVYAWSVNSVFFEY